MTLRGFLGSSTLFGSLDSFSISNFLILLGEIVFVGKCCIDSIFNSVVKLEGKTQHLVWLFLFHQVSSETADMYV